MTTITAKQALRVLILPCAAPGGEMTAKRVDFLPTDTTSRIRFLDRGPKGKTYGLRIVPPWPQGGELHINLPEHLEYRGTRGIMRWHDGEKYGVEARWKVSAPRSSSDHRT